MTRFGVSKHLHILEAAGLVVTRRRGREKLHFLNPVPIRLVHDRWVSKYAEPWAAGLADLKTRLASPMEKVFELYIRTTPQALWHAITDPDVRGKLGEGEILEIDPPRRLVQTLVQTMVALWGEDVLREGTSRIT